MSICLRATSPTTVVIGPFVSTGATAQTAIEVSSATIIDIYKNTSKSDITTTSAGANTMAHVANGYYTLQLTSSDTSVVGALVVTGDSTGSMSVWARYQIIPAAIYDAMMTGTTTLDSTFANGAQASSLLAMGVSVASSLVWNQNGAMASATTAILTNYAQASLLAVVDTVVDAIRVDVTSVLTNYAQASLLATVDTVADAIRVDVTSVLTNYAQASKLTAVQTDITSVLTNYAQASLLSTVDTVVDAIRVDVTSVLTNYAQASLLAVVDTVADAIRVDVTSVLTNYAQASKLTAVQTDITSVLTNYAQASLLSTVDTVVDAIRVDVTSVLTNYAQASKLTALQTDMTSTLVNIAALPTAATINAQVVDALATDTYAEPGQGAPAATEDIATKIGYIYKFMRNKITTTSAITSVYDDTGAVVDQKATISDDGTTFTRGEFGTGA